MLREWTSSQYLGHANLKNALDSIARAITNVVITPPGLALYPTTMTNATGVGGYLRVSSTFSYRIEGTTYTKGVGITQAANTGDATCTLIPHSATDNTATGGFDITAAYYRAGVLLIDADGTFTTIMSATQAGKTWGVSAGNRSQALAYLVDTLDTDDIDDKAIVSFFVIGDGTTAFTSTSTLTIATNLDLYNCGGMALSSGVSTDGNQMLGII